MESLKIELTYISCLSSENMIIYLRGLLEKTYEELSRFIESYKNGWGMLKRTLKKVE